MKAVIWVCCLLAFGITNSLAKAFLKYTVHFSYGAIPEVGLFGLFVSFARFLCRKWDEYRDSHEQAKKYVNKPQDNYVISSNINKIEKEISQNNKREEFVNELSKQHGKLKAADIQDGETFYVRFPDVVSGLIVAPILAAIWCCPAIIFAGNDLPTWVSGISCFALVVASVKTHTIGIYGSPFAILWMLTSTKWSSFDACWPSILWFVLWAASYAYFVFVTFTIENPKCEYIVIGDSVFRSKDEYWNFERNNQKG